jgi:Ca-activated chloride channel family protein
MARNVLITVLLLSALIFSSCSRIDDYLKVIEGNYAYSRGDYMDANFDYLLAESSSDYDHRIAYNLGNVYHSLGESEAAQEEWNYAAEAEEDPMLLYRIAFNRGVLSYETGEYQSAYSYFRQALRIDPEDIEAKVNLEFCLRKLNMRNEPGVKTEEEPESPEKKELSEDGKRILEYMRRSSTTSLKPEYQPEENRGVKDW